MRMEADAALRKQFNTLLFTYKSPYFESSVDVTSDDRVGERVM